MKPLILSSLFLCCLPASAPAVDGLPVESLVRKDHAGNEILRGDVSKISFFAEGKYAVLGEVAIFGGLAYDTVWNQYDFQGHWETDFWYNQPVRQRADAQWLHWGRDRVNYQPAPYLGYNYRNSIAGIRDLAVLPGGQLLIPGYFESAPEQLDYLPRVATLSEGFEDTGMLSWVSAEVFQPQTNELDLKVYPLADGSYLVYDGANPQDPVAARKVLANGTVQSFIAPQICGRIRQVWQQADGALLLCGGFTVVIGNTDIYLPLMRLLSNGTYDPTFQPTGSAFVQNFALQADGKILVAVQAIDGVIISRLLPNGTEDPSFQPYEPGQNLRVALAPDGRIYAFDTMGSYAPPTAPPPIMRLSNGLPEERLTVSGNTIRWMRGGTVPEINWAEFELANEDDSWTNLGKAQRISGGWEMTTPLPPNGKIRAYSYHHTTLVNAEFRQEAHFGPAPFAAWKLTQLGNTNAPDLGNPDGDALPNLIEYALASDPNAANAPFTLSQEPGQPMCLVLRRSAQHFDVDLTIEATNEPSGPWETLAQSLNGGPMHGQGFTHEAELDPDTGEFQCFICDTIEAATSPKRFYRVRAARR